MKSDIEIARSVELKKIKQVAESIGIPREEVENYGRYIAKIPEQLIDEEKVKKSNLVLVTAITATKAGIGKTTVSIGLALGLNKIGKNAIVALREPSLGPCFGMKGGAAGGGYAQVLPMDKINLHFTGDFHAITSAHNMISALLDNYLYQNQAKGFGLKEILWRRVLDVNDRSLRSIVVGLGPKSNGITQESGFDITPASEIMAILCLSKDVSDLRRRIENILLGFTYDDQPFTVKDLGVAGAAIATAISQVVSTLVYLFYIFGKKSVFDFKIKNYCLSKEVASEIFKIGIPTLVFQILTSLSISLINNAAADYGDATIAGMGVVTRLVSMGSLTIFGFIKGFQPIAGYSYGAKKFNRLHEAIKTSVIWSTVFCVVYGLILALFSTSIVSQFASGNLEMIKVGASSLRVNGISLMLFGFYTVYSSLFLALGKGKEGFILGACRQGICFVPVILVLPMIWGLNGILYAQPVADVLSAIITVFMAIHLHRELNEAEKQAAIAGTNEVH